MSKCFLDTYDNVRGIGAKSIWRSQKGESVRVSDFWANTGCNVAVNFFHFSLFYNRVVVFFIISWCKYELFLFSFSMLWTSIVYFLFSFITTVTDKGGGWGYWEHCDKCFFSVMPWLIYCIVILAITSFTGLPFCWIDGLVV